MGSHELCDAAGEGLERGEKDGSGKRVSLRIDIQRVNEEFDGCKCGRAGQERLQTERERFVAVEESMRSVFFEDLDRIAQCLESGRIERLVAI